MATAEQTIAKIQAYMRELDGVRQATDDPTESLSAAVSSICFVETGLDKIGPPELRTSLETYAVELVTPLKDLPRDHQRIIGYVDSVPNKLMLELKNDNWDGVISTFDAIDLAFVRLQIAGVDYIGYKFSVRGVKRQTAIA